MNLTTEQLRAAEEGPVTVEAEGKEFVVVSKEIYDKARQVLDYDDTEMDLREAYPAVMKAWDGSPEDDTLYADIEPEA